MWTKDRSAGQAMVFEGILPSMTPVEPGQWGGLTEQITPKPHKPFTVTCDVSKVAVGYALEQEEDGELHPVCFGS